VRILFVHEVNYLTKPIYEMHEFPEHLAARGHEVAFWHFPEGYSKEQVKELGFKREIKGRVVDGSRVTLYTSQGTDGSLFGRLMSSIGARSAAKKVVGDFRPDVIVSFSVPTQGWQTLQVAKKLGIPFMFRALDVSHRIRKGPFRPFIRAAEKFLYRNSDFVSANNQAMLEYCRNLAGRSPRCSAVHFPPLDLSGFRLGNRARGRQLLGLGDTEQVVMYMGSFFYFSGLPEVIESIALSPSTFKLVLVGGGEQDVELKSLVQERGLEGKVLFAGFIPFAKLPDVLASADVAINPMHRTLVSNAALPNKVLQYLACKVPVVATRLDGLYATFGDSAPIAWVDSPSEVISRAVSFLSSHTTPDFSMSDSFLDSLGAESVAKFEHSLREMKGLT
jgi:glycosyltransferase involved in cell wall biosynthesis